MRTTSSVLHLPRRNPLAEGAEDEINQRLYFYLEDVMIHDSPDGVVDRLQAFRAEIGMNYLMAVPVSGPAFRLVTAKVLPGIG